jgi:ubiquinone/menaquinone biosynthesis C-methylase UbiE
MPDHKQVYSHDAQQYERLVSLEDYRNNILPALNQICSFQDRDVVETGAGTGRLTRMLAPYVHSIQAFDISQHMLDVTAAKLYETGLCHWHLGTADHRHLPVPDHTADIALSGWSICYLVDWDREHWEIEVTQAIDELKRVVKPGGRIILLETQGTGFETPHPPDHLVTYYAYLKQAGFSTTWIRTDYRFESVEEAIELTQFFFGSELTETVRQNNQTILPECTGIWWLKV